MLSHLSIKNYALIRQLELNLSGGLNVITGETGAGKSILLGAIGLLLGERADSKTLWDENQKCIIEGSFSLEKEKIKSILEEEDLDYTDTTILRREVNANGKSRAFINDTPVTLEVMRKIGAHLMDIHSQHETLELGDRKFQLDLIDAFAGNGNVKESYQQAWKEFLEAKKNYDQLIKESESLKAESDYVKFQLNELASADLSENEQELLEDEQKRSENVEEIKFRLQSIIQTLGSSEFAVTTLLSNVRGELVALSQLSTSFSPLLQRLESARIELNDILKEIESEDEQTEFNPARAEEINQRLSTIYHLQQKHRVKTIADLLAIQKDLQGKSDKTNNLDDLIRQATKRLGEASQTLNKNAGDLSNSRKKIFKDLSAQLVSLLKDLGMPDAQIKIEQEAIEPSPSGSDRMEILFTANKGIAPKSLAQVASGGEFSRLMFAVKYVMAEKKTLPTLILDEIDNGVSGDVAFKLGALMKQMAKQHQLIAITHLPQIAAKGDTHYFVFKDSSQTKTESQIKELNKQERVTEIAKMIGGSAPSPVAIKNARELMEA
jgi:DNA repair protein RecN (Recombination protein N)